MNNLVARLAVLFAAFIVAGAFLNLYMFAASLVLAPPIATLGVPSEFLFTPLYVVCLFAGILSSFFVMRPAWNAVGKQGTGRNAAEEPATQPRDKAATRDTTPESRPAN